MTTGDDAFDVEQSGLHWWPTTIGAPAALTAQQMPQGGWTETASLVHVDIDATIRRINAEVARLQSL
jgi:hypothetical protein